MNRIEKTFLSLKEKNEAALVGFVSAGDPDPDRSFEIIKSMCDAGIDILELGVPFSDPSADGPVIQRSSLRALKSGITLKKVFELTEKIREITDIPIILFSYYNPVFSFGCENFYSSAQNCGADGLLIVDLPPEESDELTKYQPDGFSFIRLVAPTTQADRMKFIAEKGSGFLYMVSKTGVTGSEGLKFDEAETCVKTLSGLSPIPICVGFGISTPEDVKKVSSFADGVVIGSAFEKLIEDNLENSDLPAIMAQRVRECKTATIKQA